MNRRDLTRQFSRYLLTGGTAALVDIGLFWLASAAGVAPVPAALLSFILATVVNYRLTTRHVFDATPSWHGYGRFFIAAGLGLVVNVSMTGLLVTYAAAPPVIAKLSGIGLAFILNFLVNALVVFRPR